MSETKTATKSSRSKTTKAKTVSSAKKSETQAKRPPISQMVLTAIKNLKERNGSSSQAIKKYIGANYKIEMERIQTHFKKYLRSAVISGALTQTKGKGANGSFKLTPNQIKMMTTNDRPKVVKNSSQEVAKMRAKPFQEKTKKKTETKPKSKSPKVKKTVEKKSKTPKTAKSPKKAKTVKPKAAKKTPKKEPQKSTKRTKK